MISPASGLAACRLPGLVLLVFLFVLAGGCSTDNSSVTSDPAGKHTENNNSEQVEIPVLAAPVQRTAVALPAGEVGVLFLGNSHTASNNVPGLVEALFEESGDRQMRTRHIAGGFLDDIAARPATSDEIRSGNWDVLVLQGQKISMSGRYHYSTEAASELAAMANEAGMQVIWFSEWARAGVDGEMERIQSIYDGLAAANTRDIVAPVGQVWSDVLSKAENLVLHSRDGNHSNPDGAALAALVLNVAITGEPVDNLTWPGGSTAGRENWESFKESTTQKAGHLIVSNTDGSSRSTEERGAGQQN